MNNIINSNNDKYCDLRNSPEHRYWKKSVLKRDKKTCRECGSQDKVSAHHIKSFLKHPELRFDVDNGITLCISCHIATESFGGLRDYMLKKGIRLNWPSADEIKRRRQSKKELMDFIKEEQRIYDERIRAAVEKARITREKNKALRMITGL